MKGYQAAKKSGAKDSTPTPRSSTGPREVGGDYTVGGVTYDGKTGRPKDAPEGGYSLEPSGAMTPHTSVERPGNDGEGLSTKATVALDLEAANGLLSRGASSENPNRFLADGTQMADINSFLPAPIPVSGNDKPSAPVDQSEPTQLGGDAVAEGVVTQQKPTTISADGADNTRSVSVPGEPEGPTNWMDRANSADSFLAARRSAFSGLKQPWIRRNPRC